MLVLQSHFDFNLVKRVCEFLEMHLVFITGVEKAERVAERVELEFQSFSDEINKLLVKLVILVSLNRKSIISHHHCVYVMRIRFLGLLLQGKVHKQFH